MNHRPIFRASMEDDCPVADWKQRCAALIPCFNTGATIAEVVRAVQGHLPSVFVVDDGSTDDTAERAAEAGAEVVRHATNRGKGAALRAGFQHLGERGFAWALMLDGDGQHAADDILNFFIRAETTQARLVVGNRMEDCAAMPWLRRKVNQWMSRRLSYLTGIPLPDSQCGFRLAHLETLLELPLRADRFEIESEMLVAFIAAGNKVQFVPVQTIYRTTVSTIRPLPDTWRWLRWQFSHRKPKPREILIAPGLAQKSFSAD
ncbi:MAG: glycosyltransferase family 2 protein [Verrucomicrobia bacterium]|nr:MAG: glycosyltransferase family 2 protein [Verrucomicrobiota bacterium]